MVMANNPFRMSGSCRRRLVALVGLLMAIGDASAWTLVDRFVMGRAPQMENRAGLRRRITTRHFFSSEEQPNHASNTRKNNKNRSTAQRSNQQTQQDLLRFMDEPMSSTVGDIDNHRIMDDDLLDLVHCVVRAADGRKADNIVALQVAHVSTLASVLVILSGNSRPQNQAIAAAVTKDVAEQFAGQRPGKGVPEGSAESGWMLLDYGSVMVHIMTPKSRLFYNVEGQWRDKGGKYLDLSDILVPNKVEQQEQQIVDNGFVAKEDDPFWS